MKRLLGVIFLMLALLAPILSTLVQSGGYYDLTWNTIDGGGYIHNTCGGYSLSGTIGQPDAGLLIAGGYTLDGGFWGGGAAAVEYKVHLPLVLRHAP